MKIDKYYDIQFTIEDIFYNDKEGIKLIIYTLTKSEAKGFCKATWKNRTKDTETESVQVNENDVIYLIEQRKRWTVIKRATNLHLYKGVIKISKSYLGVRFTHRADNHEVIYTIDTINLKDGSCTLTWLNSPTSTPSSCHDSLQQIVDDLYGPNTVVLNKSNNLYKEVLT